jgi:hypothetical protein
LINLDDGAEAKPPVPFPRRAAPCDLSCRPTAARPPPAPPATGATGAAGADEAAFEDVDLRDGASPPPPPFLVLTGQVSSLPSY